MKQAKDHGHEVIRTTPLLSRVSADRDLLGSGKNHMTRNCDFKMKIVTNQL